MCLGIVQRPAQPRWIKIRCAVRDAGERAGVLGRVRSETRQDIDLNRARGEIGGNPHDGWHVDVIDFGNPKGGYLIGE